VAVIVYDVTNRASFLSVNRWLEEVKNERGEDVILVLVGNKTDQTERRQVGSYVGREREREVIAGIMTMVVYYYY